MSARSTSISMVFVTAPNMEEAANLAHRLVEEHLAACVNLVPNIRSVYRYNGNIFDESEVMLIAKTAEDRVAALDRRVRELHSYDVPEVLSIACDEGSEQYQAWVRQESREV